MNPLRKILTLTGVLILCSCTPAPAVPTSIIAGSGSSASEAAELSSSTESSIDTTTDNPDRVLLEVPFSVQAPLADWDDPEQQEGCEEMSAIMVHYYWTLQDLEPQTALDELKALTEWEQQHGLELDINAATLADVIRDYYGYEVRLIENPTIEQIETEIAAKRPVIVPAAGRELGNPYFSGEGPWYHMLVITGYDHRYFYTNDPGTRRGRQYRYRQDVLMAAVHDWTGVKEETGQGTPIAIVVEPK